MNNDIFSESYTKMAVEHYYLNYALANKELPSAVILNAKEYKSFRYWIKRNPSFLKDSLIIRSSFDVLKKSVKDERRPDEQS